MSNFMGIRRQLCVTAYEALKTPTAQSAVPISTLDCGLNILLVFLKIL